jgi:D-alanyl-lipoteichoic acid acyltransferase DltB (MBOAT superfamily)
MLIVSAAFQRYVIVESLARYGQSMSANRKNLNMFDALLWLASGPVRVVADITAYSYLAVAAALACGVKLPYDMKSPFQGHTPGEFLRRWHVTVSGFFRDYAMPLFMGNTGSESRSFISVVATCSLIGFWRAPGLTSLLWGVMLGLPVAFETIRHRRRIMSGRRRAVTPQLRVRIPLIIITFTYYALISPLTASYSLTKLWDLYSSLFTRPVFAPSHAPLLAVVCVALALVLGSGSLSRAGASCERFLDKAPASMVGVFVAVCTSACAGFASVGIPMFLYQAV